MSQATGFVTVNEHPTKSKLYRFCEKKIDKWIRSRLGTDATRPARFSVSFTEEGGARQVSCVAEIQMGDCRFRGCDLAQDPQMAFMHALKRLQPNH